MKVFVDTGEGEERLRLSSYAVKTWLTLGLTLLVALAGAFLVFYRINPWLGSALMCVFGLGLLFVVWFFRDPNRRTDAPARAMIAPADGKIVEIASTDEPNHVGGPASKIAIFMSLMDVHVNRAPCEGEVVWVKHEPGRFLNAMKPQASVENEQTLVALQDGRKRPVLLKLVAGVIARRIVCPLRQGEVLERGQRIGMIQFGSRVEVFVPGHGQFHVAVRLGRRVRAGETVLGEWR